MFARALIVIAAASVVLGNPSSRIAGGSGAILGEIPYQLSLQDKDGQHFCGGVVISPTHAITAASCIDGLDVASGQIVAGTVEIFNPGTTHKSKSVVVHPDFAIINGIPINDIAIISVNPIFPSDTNTAAAILPTQGVETPEGLVCTVSGYGTTSFGGPMSPRLQKASVPIISKTDCAALYSDLTNLPANQICAGFPEGGVDACDRDVGGPLAEGGMLYGIFSWGGRCGQPGRPGVYTEIAAFRDWIDANAV